MKSDHHFPGLSWGSHGLSQKNHADITTFTCLSIALGMDDICAYVYMLRGVQTISMYMLKTFGKVIRQTFSELV